ncbi:NAD-dependent epimerase/dehydratase family protein [Bdellovibrio sp. HCB2-146]|uniref:NAD-dependent epimerase/dehydratase family protein n=1 Tax=Bdellovibrio sp. HCB2-146 TaxID=3394362 RepID=UPI0039BD7435
MKTVVITGVAGFLGSHLAEYFLYQGYKVFGIDNFLTSDHSNIEYLQKISSHFYFQEMDASDDWTQFSEKIGNSVEFVFHFASPASPRKYQALPFETISANTQGLLKALSFARAHGARVVFASSSEVYGDPLQNPQKETYLGNVNTFGPRACYDEAKRLGETLIYEFNRHHGNKHGLVRIFNTYGPRMNCEDGRVIINFLTQAQRGENLTIFGDGSHTRSFCYVEDLIRGIVQYARSNIFEPVNLGNPQEISIATLARQVQELHLEKSLQLDFKPLPQDDPQQRRPDITKAQELLQWSPQVGLKEGLLRMKSWLHEVRS